MTFLEFIKYFWSCELGKILFTIVILIGIMAIVEKYTEVKKSLQK